MVFLIALVIIMLALAMWANHMQAKSDEEYDIYLAELEKNATTEEIREELT